MELTDALRRRRMVRSFTGAPIDAEVLVSLCAESLRAPTAGNAAGVVMAVGGHEAVPSFFAAATDETWRNSAPRAPGLMRAGAVVVVASTPQRYAERYREPDKAADGLGELEGWPVPYWHADAAMATMALLLLVEERGWQATMWGAFRHHDDVVRWAGLSESEALFGSVIVGHGDGADRRSPSLDRATPTRRDRVRRVGVQPT